MLIPRPAARACLTGSRPFATGVVEALPADEFDRDIHADCGRGARLENSPKASADPSTGLWRSLDQQTLPGELAWLESLEPDAVGRLLDGTRELSLHA
jgi:hypothetical protein